MTVASGLYGLTLEKQLIDTAGWSVEAETHKSLLVTDSYTPNFNTHDFKDDVTNEVSGTGYTAGGAALTGTELTLASGILTFDATDSSWSSSTITNAEAIVHGETTGTPSNEDLWYCLDFGAPVSTTNGTLTVAYHATGIVLIDCVP